MGAGDWLKWGVDGTETGEGRGRGEKGPNESARRGTLRGTVTSREKHAVDQKGSWTYDDRSQSLPRSRFSSPLPLAEHAKSGRRT